MSSVIRLWDTLLSDGNRFNYLNYVCITLVQTKREEIIESDFATSMELLQNSVQEVEDIRWLLNKANLVCEMHTGEDLGKHY